MLRSGNVLFGVALGLLVIGGLATGAAPWFIVLNFFSACFALFIGLYGRDRVAAATGTIALAALLIGASVVAMVRFSQEHWMYWATIGVSCAAAVIGILGAWSRSDSEVPPHIVRTPRLHR